MGLSTIIKKKNYQMIYVCETKYVTDRFLFLSSHYGCDLQQLRVTSGNYGKLQVTSENLLIAWDNFKTLWVNTSSFRVISIIIKNCFGRLRLASGIHVRRTYNQILSDILKRITRLDYDSRWIIFFHPWKTLSNFQ